MAEEKKTQSSARKAASLVGRTLKTAVSEAAESALFGRVGALGASELANALLGGSPYSPTGPAQQPEEIDRPDSPTVHGTAVAEPKTETGVAADAQPAETAPGSTASDPLQRAAERARTAAQNRSTSRQPEIG